MLSKYIYLLLITLFMLYASLVKANQPPQLSDNSKVSLITNSPWEGAVYALFGHTAIRVSDPVTNVDIIFNYGLFDFNSPNFMYRFIKGETDYAVGFTSASNYMFDYQTRGIDITEQELNLTNREKQNLLEALIVNCAPENRIYRYNYFYDNCTTRARDVIEKSVDGTIIYPTDKDNTLTYRDLVHECVNSQPWVRFGIDLIIGSGADKPIVERQIQFLPAYLMSAFRDSSIKNSDGSSRELVVKENVLLESDKSQNKSNTVDTPLIVGVFLLLTSVAISYFSYKGKIRSIAKGFDFFLFVVAGLGGSIIFFLMYFSIHPCTDANWNLVWLNPLQIIFAVLFLIKLFAKSVYYYHFINFAVLVLFLLAWFLIPQQLEVAFLPYILAIAIRSGANVAQYKRAH